MTFTIEFGWWLVPTIISIMSSAFALYITTRKPTSPAYGFDGLADLVIFGAALIISLVSWLIWAVLT